MRQMALELGTQLRPLQVCLFPGQDIPGGTLENVFLLQFFLLGPGFQEMVEFRSGRAVRGKVVRGVYARVCGGVGGGDGGRDDAGRNAMQPCLRLGSSGTPHLSDAVQRGLDAGCHAREGGLDACGGGLEGRLGGGRGLAG